MAFLLMRKNQRLILQMVGRFQGSTQGQRRQQQHLVTRAELRQEVDQQSE